MNNVSLVGNLTRDPDLRHTSSNKSVCQFGLAVNERYKDASGQWVDKPMFIDCEAWGTTGENIARYMSKGRKVGITGSLVLDQWEDKQGGKRSKHKVRVATCNFLDGKPEARGLESVGASPDVVTNDMDSDEIPF